MDPDSEVQSFFKTGNEVDDEEEKMKWKRPPSSYGSMKSDSDDMEKEEEGGEEVAAVLPESLASGGTMLQMLRSESPETLYTMTTQQTKPPGAVVIDTRSSDLGDLPEDDEEDEDEVLITNSPEPPEPIEPEDTMQTDENSQPGTLHPEQDLPHIFRTIQNALTGLTSEELLQFKTLFYRWEKVLTLQQVMTGDILDFVDKIIEVLGQDRALTLTINSLERVGKLTEAADLENQCKRALIRYHMKQYLTRKHKTIHEGILQAGKQSLLENIYVEPQISTCGYGGVDPSHPFRTPPQSLLQVPSADTFVEVNNLFRLRKDDDTPVRTVLTTGIPGIGMSTCVAKFSLDWASMFANRDLQFVIKLSFRALRILRNRNLPPSKKMSIMEVLAYYHSECKNLTYLEEENCKFLIIMDSFDRYQAPLDWENAPVINDNHTQAHPDVLIVNIIRGTVLRGARVWILGRRAAVSQIPSKFIDVITEIQGFSVEAKDEYLTKRFRNPEVGVKIVSHYKRQPTLQIFSHQPFVCWLMARMFERSFRHQSYGTNPPRVTPFYINLMVIQMNRRLQFYYDKWDNELRWSDEDKQLLTKLAKMAFKLLERNTSVFFEEDVTEFGLTLTEVTVFCGMCTELPIPASGGRRTFCFLHFTFQEFLAALYVFTTFRTESKNVLDIGLLPRILSKYNTKSAAGVLQCALARTLSSPLGHYDMFLRFLCGLLSPQCHDDQLCGCLYPRRSPKVGGLDDAQRLLEQTIQTAPADRVENLMECLREMTQEDQ